MKMDSEWILHAALRSGIGKKRNNNEDAFYFNGFYRPLKDMNLDASIEDAFPMEGALFAVCDGMGGQNNGEIASFTAVSGMKELQQYLIGREFEPSLQNWVRQAGKAVADKTDGGGCTMVLVYFEKDAVCYAHIGDSRIYKWDGAHLARVTRDHSKVEMLMAAGIITKEEAQNHPQRHVITRYIGMKTENAFEATIGRKLPLADHDRFILCSDGITDLLTDEDISIICKSTTDVNSCADCLYRTAMEHGGNDNLTAIVIDIESTGKKTEASDSMQTEFDDDEPTVVPELEGHSALQRQQDSDHAVKVIEQKITIPLRCVEKADTVTMTSIIHIAQENNEPHKLKISSDVIC